LRNLTTGLVRVVSSWGDDQHVEGGGIQELDFAEIECLVRAAGAKSVKHGAESMIILEREDMMKKK
jgi:hypothetical protein